MQSSDLECQSKEKVDQVPLPAVTLTPALPLSHHLRTIRAPSVLGLAELCAPIGERSFDVDLGNLLRAARTERGGRAQLSARSFSQVQRLSLASRSDGRHPIHEPYDARPRSGALAALDESG